MNASTIIAAASVVFVTTFGVVGLHMYGGLDHSAPARQERNLEGVPFQIQIHTDLAGNGYTLPRRQDRAIRAFLEDNVAHLKLCVLKIQPEHKLRMFSTADNKDRVMISFEVQFDDGKSFSTKPRPAMADNLGPQGLGFLSAAVKRYETIRRSKDFAYQGVRRIVDL